MNVEEYKTVNMKLKDDGNKLNPFQIVVEDPEVDLLGLCIEGDDLELGKLIRERLEEFIDFELWCIEAHKETPPENWAEEMFKDDARERARDVMAEAKLRKGAA